MAISDPDRVFALPLRSVVRDGKGGEFAALESLIQDEEVAELVVGLPLTLSGEQGSQAASATAFADELRTRFALTVHMYDERLSTQEAMRRVTDEGRGRGNRKERGKAQQADTDAIAASIILQAFLDKARFSASAGG